MINHTRAVLKDHENNVEHLDGCVEKVCTVVKMMKTNSILFLTVDQAVK